MEEIDLIDLTEATPNQIAKWVRQFKLPGRLVDLFESGKLKEAYFFIDSKAAEKRRQRSDARPLRRRERAARAHRR